MSSEEKEEEKNEDIINEQKNEIESQKDINKIDYEILLEDFAYFDLSFKIIVIGNSGKKLIYFCF